MREILFRAKRVDNGEWVEGFYGQFHNRPKVQEENSHQIFEPSERAYFCGSCVGGLWHIILPETLGQFTGLTDKNGKKIFEGDIVKFKHPVYDIFTGSVEYQICEAGFVLKDGQNFELISYASDCYEVIGNKWDNPELLEAE